MNCPSRTDDAASEHLTWNQNPPFLAADLTTCQDLNGIANSREHKEDGDIAGDSIDSVEKKLHVEQPPGPCAGAASAGHLSFELAPCMKTVVGGEGHIRLLLSRVCYNPGIPFSWSQAAWALSVIISSALFFILGTYWEADPHQTGPLMLLNTLSYNLAAGSATYGSAPLRKRASTCPVGGVDENAYNTPLHVGALFVILFVSTVACSFPMLATRFPGLRLSTRFFFAVRHFGTGVLIATAFVHLLPTAFILLGDPCLPSFWVDDYPAMPGAIALTGIFLVSVIEMIFHPSRNIRPKIVESDHDGITTAGPKPTIDDKAESPYIAPSAERGDMVPMRDMGPLGGRSSSIGRSLSNIQRQGGTDQILSSDEQDTKDRSQVDVEDRSIADPKAVALTPEQKLRKDMMQCVLLEIGILFHSVFIGMALSVSIGSEFIILLIAIAFHQTFEGLALGSRIASIVWPRKTLQPWLMALAYGCTTPIGQAIGLAIHSLYSPDSEVGLVLVGTMNAISSGLLTFASLVELLSEDFLSDDSWKVLRGRNRVYACLLVFFGAFFMSLVGAWA